MRKRLTALILATCAISVHAQEYTISSPDKNIIVKISNTARLQYETSYRGKTLIAPSPMGFEFKGEQPMGIDMAVMNTPEVKEGCETWTPVVRNKHAECAVPYSEITLKLKEKANERRRMDVTFRVMNDGVAFRYTLYGNGVIGDRKITKELTGFRVPKESSLWIPDFEYYANGWHSSQEGVFNKTAVAAMSDTIHAGLPGLIEVDRNNYMAITEADLYNYPAFYLGNTREEADNMLMLTTRLTPLPGEPDDGIKARFADKEKTSWRVIMISDNPGKFIESEMIQSLNQPCKLHDTSWIKPGMCAWDHWWSGEVKMEQPVIMQYIDFAAAMGWPYMLIDWTWYGTYNHPDAIITKPAKQLDMPAIFAYAKEKNVKIWLWLRQEDINRNDAYKNAFKKYAEWGAVGVKIDFMDRDDQEMVNWYHKIIKATAENHLMLDLHGAYKPDGIERTYPHLLTREGVLGEENYKWSSKMTPEHNITLAFTRMLAGPMDYTPGGFLNVAHKDFKNQSPTLVDNTRCAELAKFVVYESPYTVFCDHPDNVLGQPGADFVSTVPTTWDDTRFLGGYPGDYVAIARKSGGKWYVGVLNNSKSKTVRLDLSFIGTGKHTITSWSDARDANTNARNLNKKTSTVNTAKPLAVKMADAGGFVAVIE